MARFLKDVDRFPPAPEVKTRGKSSLEAFEIPLVIEPCFHLLAQVHLRVYL